MTPIKVGPYAVREAHGCTGTTDYAVYAVTDGGDFLRYFSTLPMALRVAAEAAGIERQRVELHWSDLAWVSRLDGGWTSTPRSSAHSLADRRARERYAALGGAA